MTTYFDILHMLPYYVHFCKYLFVNNPVGGRFPRQPVKRRTQNAECRTVLLPLSKRVNRELSIKEESPTKETAYGETLATDSKVGLSIESLSQPKLVVKYCHKKK